MRIYLFFSSIKMAFTQNFEGKTEEKLKEVRLKEKYKNITIYYPDEFSELMPITKETIDWAITKNEEVFGTAGKEKPVDLIVFKDKEEMKQMSNLEDVSGFYSDFDRLIGITYFDNEFKELILERKETPLYLFQKSILHEYTHYIFQRMIDTSKGGSAAYPLWFQEGIAEYIGNDKTIVEFPKFKAVSFDQLNDGNQWQDARLQDETDVYKQSYFAIKYLIDHYGESILSEIIKSTNSSGNFDGSFIKATGINTRDLENYSLNP